MRDSEYLLSKESLEELINYAQANANSTFHLEEYKDDIGRFVSVIFDNGNNDIFEYYEGFEK